MAEEFINENIDTCNNKIISIPHNYYSRSMFANGFRERRDLEQYFWTDKTIAGIRNALQFAFDAQSSCCLCTPTLAHHYWTVDQQEVSLLDIDTRFQYLPKFRYFDLRCPDSSDLGSDQHSWRVIVFDPPFFYIPLNVLYDAVIYLCKQRVDKTKLLMGFLKREEKTLLSVFASFDLKRTNFALEYAHVKPNKWRNYAMYSNIDLPGIRRCN